MTVGIHFKSILVGFLIVVAALVSAALYVWAQTVRINSSGPSGQQIFLFLFAPAIAGVCVFYVGMGIHHVWAGVTRYVLTTDDLTIRTPMRTRHIRWNSVVDFQLPPAKFPDPPATLVLVLAGGRVTLPLSRFESATAKKMLMAAVPGLAQWGLEHVRTTRATLSSLRVRWNLHKDRLFALYALPVMLLFCVLGSIAILFNFVSYILIVRHHVTVWGRVTEITRQSGKRETVRAAVRYPIGNGASTDTVRQVDVDFANRFKVGDHVAVDYLVGHPFLSRIPGWDLDGRQWILLILVLPFLWGSCRATRTEFSNWLGPIRERLFWGARHPLPCVAISPASLDTLGAVLTDKHAGTLALYRPLAHSCPSLPVVQRSLDKSGVQYRTYLDKFLILAPNGAMHLMNRLGGESSFVGDYALLDCDDVEEGERIIEAQLAVSRSENDDPSLQRIRFQLTQGAVRSVNGAEKRLLFQGWIAQRLAHLYGGLTPPQIPAVDFAELFKINPANGFYDLLIERRRRGPRIWIKDADQSRTQMGECVSGRWNVIQNVSMPRCGKVRIKKSPSCFSSALA